MHTETRQVKQTRTSIAAAGADSVDWVRLALNIDVVSLRILEKIYFPDPKPYVLGILIREISGIRVSKATIWRRVRKLGYLGLLIVVEKTKPLCVWPADGLEGNVKKLTLLVRARIFGGAAWEKR